MKKLRTIVLILASISFCVVIGGAVYEHAAFVPVWSSALPASLAMFQGEYPPMAANFWQSVHPVTVVLLLAALVLNWRTARRSLILVTIVGYLVVLAVTGVYFVPELIALTQTSYAATIDPGLTQRAARWETLSLVRLGSMIVLAVGLLLGLSRSEENMRWRR